MRIVLRCVINKMAKMLILNNPLCFLINKLNKDSESLVKKSLLDFYSCSTLIEAKRQLLDDIKELNLPTDDMPAIPTRREGTLQASRVTDDIFTVLKFLDNKLLLKDLPTYVTDNPDNIPSTRMYEGDLATWPLSAEWSREWRRMTRHCRPFGPTFLRCRLQVTRTKPATRLVTYLAIDTTLRQSLPPASSCCQVTGLSVRRFRA